MMMMMMTKKTFSVALHLLGSATWIFLTVFGAVKETQQIEDNTLWCGSDRMNTTDDDNDDGGYFYSSSCYTVHPYDPSYRVLCVVGGSLGIMHASLFLAETMYRALFLCSNILFLLRTHVLMLTWVPVSTAGVYTFQHLVYHVLFCAEDGAFCGRREHQQPEGYDVLRRVYLCLLVLGSVTFTVYLSLAGTFVYIFSFRRWHTWRRIVDVENSLMLTPGLCRAFRDRDEALTKTSDMQNFVLSWGKRGDDAILEVLPDRAARVTDALISEIIVNDRGEGAAAADTTSERREKRIIPRSSFLSYAERVGRISDPLRRQNMWNLLTNAALVHGKRTEDDGNDTNAVESMDAASVEDLLYELFFDRKQLANAIRTDRRVIRFLLRYSLFTLYPACFIVMAKIFGYADAFGEGIDLFKTYAVIVSYLYSTVLSDLSFVALMLGHRPFQIGDVLSFDGDIYEVEDFTSSHTMLSGSTARMVSNRSFLGSSVINLTSNSVSQSFDVRVPSTSTFDVRDLHAAIGSYMEAHPRDISASSVRCGWIDVDGVNGKTLRCNWRYKFRIFDRSRLNRTRTRILTHLVNACNPHVVHATTVENVLAGGGDAPHLPEVPSVTPPRGDAPPH